MQKQFLFIHERREIVILCLLILMITTFAFTLGIHMGKNFAARPEVTFDGHTEIPTTADKIPSGNDLNELARSAPKALGNELTEQLKKQVQETGIKLDKFHATELPEKAKTKSGGATTP